MNIIEIEDMVKGLPDQALMREAQAPTGQLPQFLVISEIKRREDMRRRFNERQGRPARTVREDILSQAAGQQAPMPPPGGQQPMAPPGGGIMDARPPTPAAELPPAPTQRPVKMMAEGGLTSVGAATAGRGGGLTLEDLQMFFAPQGSADPRRAVQYPSLVERLGGYEPTPARGIAALFQPATGLSFGGGDEEEPDFGPPIPERAAGRMPPMLTPSATYTMVEEEVPEGRAPGMPGTGLDMIREAAAMDPTAAAMATLQGREFQMPASVDYGEFEQRYADRAATLMDEAAARADQLISAEEARGREMTEQARQDAFAQALIQLGSGIAAGDMAGGFSRAGTTAQDIKRQVQTDARDSMRLARRMARDETQAARVAAEGALNRSMLAGMKTAEGRVAAQNALQEMRDEALTTLADFQMEAGTSRQEAMLALGQAYQKAESDALRAAREAQKQVDLNFRQVLDLVSDALRDQPMIATGPGETQADVIAAMAQDVARQLGVDLPGPVREETPGETTGFEGFSATRVQ